MPLIEYQLCKINLFQLLTFGVATTPPDTALPIYLFIFSAFSGHLYTNWLTIITEHHFDELTVKGLAQGL